MFSRMGSAAYKKDLTNTITLCEALGNPHKKFKSIHIGGTNGKGSVSHMLASLFSANSYKTGLYTSPHLFDFRERIRIDGQMIEESFVVDFTERIKPLIERIEPSFFEITVAMAFDYFAQQKVDVAIVEVGLGGRLDSTNIITPELSVITNIGWDHMNLLGDTLQKIAAEKAGIIKPNVPVVMGEKDTETKGVFIGMAKEKGAPLYFAEDNFSIQSYKWEADLLQIEIKELALNETETYCLDLPGIYQTKNVCTVLQSLAILKEKFSWDDEKTGSALANVKGATGFFGRWEVIGRNPKIVLDVAHNEAGIKELLRQLIAEDFVALHIVLGIVKDKDADKVLNLLPKEAAYYFTQAHIPRALAANDLHEQARGFGLVGEVYENVNEALAKAKVNASHKDLVLVCGSIFLIGEVSVD